MTAHRWALVGVWLELVSIGAYVAGIAWVLWW